MKRNDYHNRRRAVEIPKGYKFSHHCTECGRGHHNIFGHGCCSTFCYNVKEQRRRDIGIANGTLNTWGLPINEPFVGD